MTNAERRRIPLAKHEWAEVIPLSGIDNGDAGKCVKKGPRPP